MINEERVPYEMLKSWALDCYFEGCRDHAVKKGWSHTEILGYVIYQFEDVLERPVEVLMWQVILLVLSGGWHSDWDFAQRELISISISKAGLDNILKGLPDDEKEVFQHDLENLNLI